MTDFQFPLAGPINLSCRLNSGSLTVHAEPGRQDALVTATARHASSDVLQRSSIELQGNTLVVHVPAERGRSALGSLFGHSDRRDEVDLVISLPEATAGQIRVGSADVTMHGRSGSLDLGGGSADVTIAQVDGELRLHTGSGDVRAEQVAGSASIKSGSGSIWLGQVGADLVASTGSGRFELQRAGGKVQLRSGSGSAEIGSIEHDVDLVSGSGSMTIGLMAGVQARLDARTGSGRVHTEMPLDEAPKADGPVIEVKARTGSGNITVRRTASVAG